LFGPLGMNDTALPASTSNTLPDPYSHGYIYGLLASVERRISNCKPLTLERDRAKREALLHRTHHLTMELVMFAPIMDFRALMGVRAAGGGAYDQLHFRASLPDLGGYTAEVMAFSPARNMLT
jgi:hypothetical protein